MEYNKKEELFDKINGLKITNPNLKETWFNWGVNDSYERVEMFFNKELVPEVPQYVADWYENHNYTLDYSIWNNIRSRAKGFGTDKEVSYWIEEKEDAIITLVKMHLFGYKVEKVDLFRVKLANGGQYLYTESSGNTYFTCVSKSEYSKEKLKELGFEWVLDCPGILLEEV